MQTQIPLPVVPLKALIEVYKACPRMTHRKWVQWAVLCAKRTLPRFTEAHPNDNRPAAALAAAEAWLANPTERNADAATRAADAATYATRDAATRAADAATYAAAHAAARAATYAAYAADAATYAAYAAYAADAATYAAYAAYAAAHAAARAATYAAEQQWQALRLMDIYHTEDCQ